MFSASPRRLTGCCVAAIIALSTSQSLGATLVTYAFTGYTSSDAGSAATSTAAGVSATNFAPNGGTVTPPTGFRGVAQINGGPSNYMFDTNTNTAFGIQSTYTAASDAAAATADAYYSFTLTPAAGSALSFAAGDTLTFAQQTRINSGPASPYSAHFAVRSSADGFASLVGASADLTQTGTGSTGLVAGRSIDLSSIGALAAGAPLTIRFYPVDNQQANADDIKVDDVVVNGALITAVPEPLAAAGLLGVGGLSVLGRRRVR